MSPIVPHLIFAVVAILATGLGYGLCSAQWIRKVLWRMWTSVVLVVIATAIYIALATAFGYFDLSSLKPLFEGWNKQPPPPISGEWPPFK